MFEDLPPEGYWLIEPDEFELLMANPQFRGFARCFLHWIARQVANRLDLTSEAIELTAIDAEYLGKYPCLAARGLRRPITDDQASRILKAIQSQIHSVTVAEMLAQIEADGGRSAGCLTK